MSRSGGDGGDVNYGRGWERCSHEGGFCSFRGSAELRFGAGGRFVTRRGINGLPCDTDPFGNDPTYGQKKQCPVRGSER